MPFGCLGQNIKSKPREVVGDLHKAFCVFERINHQFKTSGLKNVKTLVEQTVKH